MSIHMRLIHNSEHRAALLRKKEGGGEETDPFTTD